MLKKLISHEIESIKNISDGIKNIKKNTCYYSDGRIKSEKTCKLSNDNINKISYFLSHKLPKCKKLDITLDNIRDGKIISRGSFGYSFYSAV